MARVFISYRRRDNPYVAGILRDALQGRFGIDEVFFDLDNIPFGVDFRQYIANAVGSCAVLLVVIGDQWLHLTDEQGRRRLDNRSDFVRIEIEAALKRDIPVVPVLIETAQMPAESELPESIREFAFRNAAEIRAGRDLKQHVERLVSGLAESLKARISRPAEEDSAPFEEEVPVAPEPRGEIARSTEGTTAAAKSPVEPMAAAKAKISPSKEEESATSAEKGSVAPKRREEITHRGEATSAPAKPFVRAVPVAEVSELAPSRQRHWRDRLVHLLVLRERATFVEKARKAFKGGNNLVYFAGAIPLAKGTAATTAYAPQVPRKEIMLLYDSSIFGGAKSGVLLTTDAIYWHNLWSDQGNCRYADIRAATINTNNNLLINGDKEIAVVTEIVRGLMKLLVELLPDLQLAEELEPILQSVSAEERAFLEKCGPLQDISDRLWLKGEIPAEKALAATKKYAPNVPLESIMLLYDDTNFGGANDGLLLTVDSIYWHNLSEEAEHCRYSDIKDLSVSGPDHLIINGKKINMYFGREANGTLVDLLGRLKA
jgi:TIR domain